MTHLLWEKENKKNHGISANALRLMMVDIYIYLENNQNIILINFSNYCITYKITNDIDMPRQIKARYRFLHLIYQKKNLKSVLASSSLLQMQLHQKKK